MPNITTNHAITYTNSKTRARETWQWKSRPRNEYNVSAMFSYYTMLGQDNDQKFSKETNCDHKQHQAACPTAKILGHQTFDVLVACTFRLNRASH